MSYLTQITQPLAPNLSPSTGEGGLIKFGSLVQLLIEVLFIAAFVVFFFMFVLGAIRWIVSSGDKTKLEAAQGTITNSLIGLVLLLSLFAIVKLIETLFGVSVLQIDLGALKL